MQYQLSLFDAILDLFRVNPLSLIGLLLVIGLLIWSLSNENGKTKLRVAIASILLFYYLLISLTNIFGVPSLGDFTRLSGLGEPLFQPNVELMPLADGFSFSFILNIVAFLPIGFLVPMISPTFRNLGKTALLGALFSLMIEISQLFTMYRATDINDLLTNTLGTLIGYGCFMLFAKLFFRSMTVTSQETRTKYLPGCILLIGFLNVFLLP